MWSHTAVDSRQGGWRFVSPEGKMNRQPARLVRLAICVEAPTWVERRGRNRKEAVEADTAAMTAAAMTAAAMTAEMTAAAMTASAGGGGADMGVAKTKANGNVAVGTPEAARAAEALQVAEDLVERDQRASGATGAADPVHSLVRCGTSQLQAAPSSERRAAVTCPVTRELLMLELSSPRDRPRSLRKPEGAAGTEDVAPFMRRSTRGKRKVSSEARKCATRVEAEAAFAAGEAAATPQDTPRCTSASGTSRIELNEVKGAGSGEMEQEAGVAEDEYYIGLPCLPLSTGASRHRAQHDALAVGCHRVWVSPPERVHAGAGGSLSAVMGGFAVHTRTQQGWDGGPMRISQTWGSLMPSATCASEQLSMLHRPEVAVVLSAVQHRPSAPTPTRPVSLVLPPRVRAYPSRPLPSEMVVDPLLHGGGETWELRVPSSVRPGDALVVEVPINNARIADFATTDSLPPVSAAAIGPSVAHGSASCIASYIFPAAQLVAVKVPPDCGAGIRLTFRVSLAPLPPLLLDVVEVARAAAAAADPFASVEVLAANRVAQEATREQGPWALGKWVQPTEMHVCGGGPSLNTSYQRRYSVVLSPVRQRLGLLPLYAGGRRCHIGLPADAPAGEVVDCIRSWHAVHEAVREAEEVTDLAEAEGQALAQKAKKGGAQAAAKNLAARSDSSGKVKGASASSTIVPPAGADVVLFSASSGSDKEAAGCEETFDARLPLRVPPGTTVLAHTPSGLLVRFRAPRPLPAAGVVRLLLQPMSRIPECDDAERTGAATDDLGIPGQQRQQVSSAYRGHVARGVQPSSCNSRATGR